MMTLNGELALERADAAINQGRRYVRLYFDDGSTADLYREHKEAILNAGWVSLGAGWGNRVKPQIIEGEGIDSPITLEGFTDCPTIHRLYSKFVKMMDERKLGVGDFPID